MPDDYLDDVLDALETVLTETGTPVANATEVADALPYERGRRRVLEDLRALERADEVASKEAGAKARVWWPDAPRAPATPASPEVRTERDHAADGARETLEDVVDDVEVPGENRELEDQRRDAVRECLRYLGENGEAYRRDLEADVYPEAPAEYETADSWWSNAMRPALSELADRDSRLEKASTRDPWVRKES